MLVRDLQSSSETKSKRVKRPYHMQESLFLASRASLSFEYQTLPRNICSSAEIACLVLPRHRSCLSFGSESRDL